MNVYKLKCFINKTIIAFYFNIHHISPLNVQLVKKETEYYA